MSSAIAKARRNLRASNLNQRIREHLDTISGSRQEGKVDYSLSETLMAGFAMFQFKMPSMLQFENGVRGNEPMIGNLKRLYRLDKVPSDSRMREILDPVSPASLRGAFRAVQSVAQQTRVLEEDRKPDLQHPEEPRLSSRAQLRARQTVPLKHTGRTDAARLSV